MLNQCFIDPSVTFIPKKDFLITQLKLLIDRRKLTYCDEGKGHVDRYEDSNHKRIASLQVV